MASQLTAASPLRRLWRRLPSLDCRYARAMASESTSTPELYDEIASLYHLVYEDWEGSVRRQAEALDGIVRERIGAGPHAVLDASCGIGTQTIGLAALGHQLTASDLSEASVARARVETQARGLDVAFEVRDMRECDRGREAAFDVVLSADNSVPHLLTRADVLSAFRAFYNAARPGGITLVSVRDYQAEDLRDAQMRPYGIRETPAGRALVFQTWDVDGEHYDVTMYFVIEGRDGSCRVQRGRSRYWAVTTDVLATLLEEAGFEDVERIDGRFFQPVLVGKRGAH